MKPLKKYKVQAVATVSVLYEKKIYAETKAQAIKKLRFYLLNVTSLNSSKIRPKASIMPGPITDIQKVWARRLKVKK